MQYLGQEPGLRLDLKWLLLYTCRLLPTQATYNFALEEFLSIFQLCSGKPALNVLDT